MFHGDFQELSQRSDNFSGVYDFDRIALKRWSLPTHHPSRDLWLKGHLDVRYLAKNALSEMYRHFWNPRGSSSKLTCQDSRRAEKPSSGILVPSSLKQSIMGFFYLPTNRSRSVEAWIFPFLQIYCSSEVRDAGIGSKCGFPPDSVLQGRR